jgi:hypothetical protein
MKKKFHDLIIEHISKLILGGILSFTGLVLWQAFVVVPDLQASDKDKTEKIDRLMTVTCRMAILQTRSDEVILQACNK